MAQVTKFTIGAEVADEDGPVGEVRGIVVEPASWTVTHLVVEPKHRFGLGRLVPVDLAEVRGEAVHLDCDSATFDSLPKAEEVSFVRGADDWRGEGLVEPEPEVDESLPSGEISLGPDESVHALDGELGRLDGVLTEGGDRRVTHILLREGHILRHREVAIPIAAVTGTGDGLGLDLTKQQVEELPPIG
jgi:hypothetical protein